MPSLRLYLMRKGLGAVFSERSSVSAEMAMQHCKTSTIPPDQNVNHRVNIGTRIIFRLQNLIVHQEPQHDFSV